FLSLDQPSHEPAAVRALLGLSESLFGDLAVRYVAHGGDHQQAFVGRHRAQADVDWKFSSIAPPPEQLETLPDRPALRVAEILGPVSAVAGAKRIRDELVDRHAEQLRTRVAEEL